MRTRFLAVCGSVLGAMTLLLALSATAHAAVTSARPAPPSNSKLIKTSMHIVSFNAAVAKAHGYEIRTNAQGLQYSVKIGSKLSLDSNPVVYGNCGDSYIYYSWIGYRSASPHYGASTYTGYDVIAPAVEGHWQVTYVDNAGTGTVNTSNAANGTPFWSTSYDTWHSVTGYSYADVDPNGSWALLDNGALCYSGGPWDSTTLQK